MRGHWCFQIYLDSTSSVEETHKDDVNLIRYEHFVCRKGIKDVLCLVYFTVLAQLYLFCYYEWEMMGWLKVMNWNKGSCGLFWRTVSEFAWRKWVKLQKEKASEKLDFQSQFRPDTSWKKKKQESSPLFFVMLYGAGFKWGQDSSCNSDWN